MYGDFLVPTNTNVNNAMTTGTGGKWELFFEETRDEEGNVGYEWDKDFDDLPLNLNGVLVTFELPSITTIATSSITINNKNIVNNRHNTTTVKTYTFTETVIKHGKLTILESERNTQSEYATARTGNKIVFLDSIKQFAVSFTNVVAGSVVKVYVLRGV